MEEAQTINRPALAEKVEALRDLRDQKAAIDKQIKALTKEITKHIPSATERTADKGTMTFVQNRKELVPSVRWFFHGREKVADKKALRAVLGEEAEQFITPKWTRMVKFEALTD